MDDQDKLASVQFALTSARDTLRGDHGDDVLDDATELRRSTGYLLTAVETLLGVVQDLAAQTISTVETSGIYHPSWVNVAVAEVRGQNTFASCHRCGDQCQPDTWRFGQIERAKMLQEFCDQHSGCPLLRRKETRL